VPVARKQKLSNDPLISKLREIRLRKGWRIRDLAKRSGWPERSIIAWEAGERDPAATALRDVFEAMGAKLTVEEPPE